MPDPKLKTAAEEIKAILKKHDIAGNVILVSKTHAEFVHELAPTWSAITVEKEASGLSQIRIRAKEAELGSKDAVIKKVELTTHLLCQFRDLSARSFSIAETLIEQIGKIYQIDHKPFSGFEPHKEI